MRRKLNSLPFRRKRKGKTDYKNRLQLLSAKKLRLVVRKSLKNVLVQVIDFHPDGDKVLLTASTTELQKKFGWDSARRNIPAAYLTGCLIGIKAKEKKIVDVVVDIGMQKAMKGSILFATIKGAIDAGLNIPHDPKIFPAEERLIGKHIKFKNTSFDKVKEAITNKGK